MDGYVVHGGMALERGGVVRIEDGKGMLFYVWDGELWITQDGDSRDFIVPAGGSLTLDRDGVTLAQALDAPTVVHIGSASALGAWSRHAAASNGFGSSSQSNR